MISEEKFIPCCVIGDCRRPALDGDWCCKQCADKYGAMPLDPHGELVPSPEVFSMEPA